MHTGDFITCGRGALTFFLKPPSGGYHMIPEAHRGTGGRGKGWLTPFARVRSPVSPGMHTYPDPRVTFGAKHDPFVIKNASLAINME